MGDYQAKLQELTQDEIVSQLEGDGGLLALTRSEIFYISPEGAQRAALSDIKKVVGGKGGVLQIIGNHGPLIEAPVQAFQVDELRLFFESVKTYVARDQKQTSSAAVARPAPAPEKVTSDPVTLDEELDLPPPISPPEELRRPVPAYNLNEPAHQPPAARRGNAVTGTLLKITSIATLALAGFWAYQNPITDLTQFGLVLVAGLGAALLEWHVSDL